MIYLDNNATTKIAQRVYYKQCEALHKYYGNPSSLYPFGTLVREKINEAREKVARLINANLVSKDKIIFTSCATESNNTVFSSVLLGKKNKRRVVISSVEHPSVMESAARLESQGCTVIRVPVNLDGVLDEQYLYSAITDDTALVSIMLANNETGVIFPIQRITSKIKKIWPEVFGQTDAVQAIGKINVDVKALGVDFLTISGHKFCAPKGVGALFISSNVNIPPFIIGGHQESNMRAGTENTASIIAMGDAAQFAMENLENGVTDKVCKLRDLLEAQISSIFSDIMIFGKAAPRVCNTSNISFKGWVGEKLVLKLAAKEICVSSGSACSSNSKTLSYVLEAMNAPADYASSIRISFGYENTENDILSIVEALKFIILNQNVYAN